MISTKKKACAKLNLGLDVVARREDGYHAVVMVMQSTDLCDELEITADPEGENDISMEIISGHDFIDVSELPTDDGNLCIAAAKEILDAAGEDRGSVRIKLKKCIPFEAGLGGGSADAAEVLVGINELLDLGFSVDELCAIGGRLGADIPFAIKKGTMLAEGIGEKLQRIGDGLCDIPVVIVKPPFGASTKEIYEAWDSLEDKYHPHIDRLTEGIKGRNLGMVLENIGNSLWDVTCGIYPVLGDIRRDIAEAGALAAMMTGSGTAIFGIFEDTQQAKVAEEILRRKHQDCFVVMCRMIQ